MIIDSHVHVGAWKYPPVEEYQAAMSGADVGFAVLAQFVGAADNRYLARCVERSPDRFAAIAMVEHETPGAAQQIARIAATGSFVGIRLPAAARTPGADPLAVWRAIAAHGLVASVRGPLADIAAPEFAEIVDEVPDLKMRLEHVGFTQFPAAGADRSHFDRFLQLATRPQIHSMWAGFYANSGAGYPYPDADPFLRDLIAAFGAQRITWGGDWNQPDAAPGAYQAAVRHVLERPYLTSDDTRWILGGAAAALFHLPGGAQ
ncbi:amidohydrolase [Occultella aeris]|uniref:Amidohydrolase n=1 Tax=Occultella aeris TaxID=2761496 RepID=A0A7M4DFI1_9MICO|nr:amidohydrolase family protein [Occultella aeris]VZO35674.1 Amidohydrolase [Occultella aeris]